MNIRCNKCNGLLCGNFEYTGDFYCKGHPEESTHLVGWECPRCRTIHSPFVPSCGCAPPSITTSTAYLTYWKNNIPQ